MAQDTRGGWRQWTLDEARSALAEHARSGKSEAAFARDSGCSTQRLQYWRRRLAEIDRVHFAEVAVPVAPTPTSSGTSVEITMGTLVVRIRDLDEGATARLILALAKQPPC